jgi:hypothetical protein
MTNAIARFRDTSTDDLPRRAARGLSLAMRIAALALLGTAGCLTNDTLRADLQRRASFDLSCGSAQLVLTPLGAFPNGITNTYGVSGCGRKVTYVLLNTGVWALNTGDEGANPSAPQR